MNAIGYAHGGVEGVLLQLRSPSDVFEGPSKRRARGARDAEILDTSRFDDDGRLAIIIKFRHREIWQVRREGEWVDVCVMDSDADDDEE